MIKEQRRYIKQQRKIFTGSLKNYQMLLIIFILNFLLFYVFRGGAMVFSNSSRELYIPMAMNDGYVLYKDIFNVYAPLGYQLNAFLLNIFGENLETFYIAGFINSTLILFGLFYILKLFIKQGSLLILSILFLVIPMCLYAVSQTNYIFPYSYSLVYALCSFIWSLTALLYFIKENKNILLYLSFFFFGMSISFKYEFIPFAMVLIFVLIYKKVSFKTLSACIFSFCIIPLLSLSDLLLKGVSFNTLKEAITYMLLLANAKSVKVLYTYLGFIPSIASLKVLLSYFIRTFLIFAGIILFFAFALRIGRNLAFKNNNRFILLSFLVLFCAGYFLLIFYLAKIFIISNAFYFNWIGIFALILFILFCIKLVKKHKEKSIEVSDILFFILSLSTILCSFKCIFNISFNSYGTYYFPLLFICCILYFYIYKIEGKLIKRKKLKDIKYLTLLIMVIFIIGNIYYFSNLERFRQVYGFCAVPIEKGLLMPGQEQIEPIYETVNYIKNNTNKNDRILVLPEGSAINFLTDRKSHNKYYYLIPPNIEIFGEDNIVNDLEKDLPEYLIIQPMSYNNFKETYFSESFGQKICALIPKYYEKPIVFGKEFWLAIYKKKVKNEK